MMIIADIIVTILDWYYLVVSRYGLFLGLYESMMVIKYRLDDIWRYVVALSDMQLKWSIAGRLTCFPDFKWSSLTDYESGNSIGLPLADRSKSPWSPERFQLLLPRSHSSQRSPWAKVRSRMSRLTADHAQPCRSPQQSPLRQLWPSKASWMAIRSSLVALRWSLDDLAL